jgi:hypothetical protein
LTEAKEMVGGYAIYEVRSKEEAIEASRRFMQLHADLCPGVEAVCEVRQIAGPDDSPNSKHSTAPPRAVRAAVRVS